MRLLFIFFAIFLAGSLSAEDHHLDSLIAAGLENNLALQQRSISVDQSISMLRQARGLFFPSLSIQARYSRAGGGREIEFPVGDLLNPVYQSLNQLLVNSGEPPQPFPTLENERIPFLRKEEHETKLQLIQPIFQPAILFNYQLNQDLLNIEDAGFAVYKRQLINDIQEAYYNYLISSQIVKLYQRTKSVLEENLRVSQALLEVQKVTRDAIYRAQAELSALESDLLSSENQKTLARSYLNFLLNRPLTTDIGEQDSLLYPQYQLPEFSSVQQSALQNREELKQIRFSSSVARRQKNIANSAYFPAVTAVVDYGFQGEKYRFTSNDDYWMASLVLQWNLFNGFQDKAKSEFAYLEQQKHETRQSEISEQIQLEVRQAYDNCLTSLQKIEVSKNRMRSAKASFEIVQKKYEQGIAPQIEFLDARNDYTNAEITAIIAHYNFFICQAQLERIAALREINNLKTE